VTVKTKRPVVHKTSKDGEAVGTKTTKAGKRVAKYKTYPNGIQVTFGALWQYWWEYAEFQGARSSDSSETSAVEFGEIFDLASIAAMLQAKYKDIKPPATPKSAGEAFQEVGNGTCVGLDYFRLRWASELIDLPVGLFVLFTHLISRERRLHNKVLANEIDFTGIKVGLTSLLDQVDAFAQKAREIIDGSDENGGIFYEEFPLASVTRSRKNSLRDGEAAYLARLSVLKELVDAVHAARSE
jgi:hypothetical protein